MMTILSQVLILAGSVWTVIQIMGLASDDTTATASGANTTATTAAPSASENCDSAKILCFINIGCAVVHALISIYIQNAIVNKIAKMHEEEGEDSGVIRSDDVMKATKHIIMYDFVFCFYVFFLPAATFYNCYGISTLTGTNCETGNGPAWAAAMAMIGYGFATMCYLPCMYCGTCCAAGTKKVVKKGKKGAEKTVEQPVV